ncbi:MAG: hypothetical protein ABS69_00665 [Nitrosomonadales bacterium SCN 54-20]|nr:MAG: hypothetical protein ABS69_00665 [Nitrosomonadales bacterium SCN 54-20]
MEKSQQDLLELLAYCTATSINTVSGKENAPSDEVAALMTALNLDMADWWEATVENYLSHVPKDRILAIVAEAVSPPHAQSMNGLKKVDLARQAEQVYPVWDGCRITSRQLNCRKSSSPDRRGPL